MENALKAWAEISREAAGRSVFLFLDFDGTLASIAETPDKAVLPEETKTILGRFRDASRFRLAVISGRSIEDIKTRVGLEGVIYAGNHGLEIRGPGIEYSTQIMPRLRSVIEQIKKDLKDNLSDIDGVVLEDKGLSVSVHYRLVKGADMRRLLKGLREAVDSFLVRGKMAIKKGKKVFEIMPPSGWDKGRAVLWLLEQSRTDPRDEILPVYIGDDETDEDAFKALKEKGVCVRVGKSGNTFARYELKNTDEVVAFLRKLAELKKFHEHVI